LRGKVPLYHFIKTPVEPPGRMTAAVEAPSIRAPDDPVTIHYSTAPVPRALQLPSTTFLPPGRPPLPPAAYTDASGPREPTQALGRTTRRPAVRRFSPQNQLSNSNNNNWLFSHQPTSSKRSIALLIHFRISSSDDNAERPSSCCRISEVLNVFYRYMSSAQFFALKQALIWTLKDAPLTREQIGSR
jgi:hypothetical protein